MSILIISPEALLLFIFCNEGTNQLWYPQPLNTQDLFGIFKVYTKIVSHPRRGKWSMWLLLAASRAVKSKTKAEIW